MARADRLFDIIQILRLSRAPVTATAIAAELEVTPRTIYRDIAILQARRVPIFAMRTDLRSAGGQSSAQDACR